MNIPKLRVIILSHGEQSAGMLNTAEMLVGEQQNVVTYGLMPAQSVADLTAAIENEVKEYGAENIIFMSELMHGSPFNAVVSLTREYDLYHITGINLAMLLSVLLERNNEDATAKSVCEEALATVATSIADVRQLLAVDSDDDE